MLSVRKKSLQYEGYLQYQEKKGYMELGCPDMLVNVDVGLWMEW